MAINLNNFELQDQNEFSEIIKTSNLVIVYFWAPWCQPCKRFAPKYEEFAQNSALPMKKIDIDNQNLQQIAIDYGVQSVPTIIAFSKGIEIGREIGVPDNLDQLVKSFSDIINNSK